MTDDRSEKRVIEVGDDGPRADIWAKHGVVDLRLIEETTQFVIGIFPDNVDTALAVDIDCRPVAVLCAA